MSLCSRGPCTLISLAFLPLVSTGGEAPVAENPPARVYEMPQARGTSLSDAQVANRLRQALASDSIVRADMISVEVGRGTVTLIGQQPLLLARERAAYIAETQPGVHRVVNELEVRPHRTVGSARLQADIVRAIRADPALERSEIRVRANDDGTAFISGVVDSGAERHLAENLVKSISGVTESQSELQVRREQTRSDAAIAADVRRMLQWDPDAAAAEPEVSVEDGVVTLSGVVRNAAEQRTAAGLSWVSGVKHVDVTQLEIKNPTSSDRAVPGTPLELQSDQAIAAAVREAIQSDPRLDESAIEVHVSERVVTLTGQVPDPRARQIARNVPYGLLGVASVNDRLTLAGGLAAD